MCFLANYDGKLTLRCGFSWRIITTIIRELVMYLYELDKVPLLYVSRGFTAASKASSSHHVHIKTCKCAYLYVLRKRLIFRRIA